MSVTPTDEALVVSLECEGCCISLCLTHIIIDRLEGVGSIERSLQEDTYLVLFNTAISNLVSRCFVMQIPYLEGS